MNGSATNIERRRPRRIAADEAHAWARNLRLNNPLGKLTLSMLTLYVNGEGLCFVSIEQLAEDTELAADTVRKRLAWLESIGAIARLPQWVDASGRRNGESRGRRTSDEIQLLITADESVIEARAQGGDSESIRPQKSETDGDAASISPRSVTPSPQEGVNGTSPALALRQPSDSDEGLTSEPEPEEELPQTPSEPSGFAACFEAFPDWKLMDRGKGLRAFEALEPGDRRLAVRTVQLYASDIARTHRKPVNFENWIAKRMFANYSTNADAETTKRIFIPEATEPWQAWCNFAAVAYGEQRKIPHYWAVRGGALVVSEWPAGGKRWLVPFADWVFVERWTPQFNRWSERVNEIIGRPMVVTVGKPMHHAHRLITKDGAAWGDRDISGALVPSEWPPPKGEAQSNAA